MDTGQKLLRGGYGMKAFYETRDIPFFIGDMNRTPFPMHVHEIVEMILLLRGRCTMIIDGKTCELQPGDTAFVFPLMPHSYEAMSADVDGLAAFFPADFVPELSGIFHTQLPDEPAIRGALENEDVAIAAEHLARLPENAPTRLAYLHLMLSALVPGMRFHSAAAYNERGLGTRVVRYVYEHACEDITLAAAAHDLGVSESHLSHLFAQQFHVNFRSFINAIRIDKATMLMRDPYLTLTQICFQCGYENSRTFRRAFVRETGMLPAVYMRNIRSEPQEAI